MRAGVEKEMKTGFFCIGKNPRNQSDMKDILEADRTHDSGLPRE